MWKTKLLHRQQKENVSIEELTRRNEEVLFRDFDFLKIKVPNYTVRASSVIDQSAKMISTLVKKDYAYWHKHGNAMNAYFDPLKFAGFGKLARLDMNKWPKKKRRFHKDTLIPEPRGTVATSFSGTVAGK